MSDEEHVSETDIGGEETVNDEGGEEEEMGEEEVSEV